MQTNTTVSTARSMVNSVFANGDMFKKTTKKNWAWHGHNKRGKKMLSLIVSFKTKEKKWCLSDGSSVTGTLQDAKNLAHAKGYTHIRFAGKLHEL